MRHFCTLFDKNYLSRGLMLYSSLKTHHPNFTLYVLALDSETEQFLRAKRLDFVKVIGLAEFENEDLLFAKGSRPLVQYFWTCTPAIVKFCLDEFALPNCTYLDADIYFKSNPELVLQTLGSEDVLITPHHYADRHDQSKTSGSYCVQFMYFGGGDAALNVLDYWYERCLESCELSPEKGICGDQKYLDEWPNRFQNVIISEHRGLGVAPWNTERYEFDGVYITDKYTGRVDPILFFHFHSLKVELASVVLSGPRYKIGSSFLPLYREYVAGIVEIEAKAITAGFSLTRTGPREDSFGAIKRVGKGGIACITDNFNFRQSLVSFLRNKYLNVMCPICSKGHARLVVSDLYDDRYGYPDHFFVFECQHCKHRHIAHSFVENATAELYENYYQRKREIEAEISNMKYQDNLRGQKGERYDRAYSRISSNSSVVEIGCGKGENLLALQAKNCDVVGYELDSSVQKIAEVMNLPIRCRPFDVKDFSGKKVDYVIFEQVLEHIIDPISFLDQVKGVLKKDGKIVFSVPRYLGLCGTMFGRYWLHWHCPFHIHFFSDSSLRALADKTGTAIQSVDVVAPSEWLYYQLLHMIYYPGAGEKSRFWTGDIRGKLRTTFLRKVAGVLNRLGILKIVARTFSFFKLADNYIVVLVVK